jgi:SAM-dependent methyltransferase
MTGRTGSLWPDFLALLKALPSPRVLEVGTRKWDGRSSTRRAAVLDACPSATHLGIDALAGEDVDLVCDASDMLPALGEGAFDAAILVSVLEHAERPWLVAEETKGVLRPGGLVYASAPWCFPYHPYPGDYWRFSPEGLRSLFAAGFEEVATSRLVPAVVVPLHNEVLENGGAWNFEAENWLASEAIFRRRP